MSDPKVQQINQGIVRALEEVAKRFAEDPTPTDGSFQAALEKLGMRSKVRVSRPARTRSRAR